MGPEHGCAVIYLNTRYSGKACSSSFSMTLCETPPAALECGPSLAKTGQSARLCCIYFALSWAAHSCLPLLGCTLMSPSLGLHTHVSLSSSSSSSPQWRSKIFVPGASLQTCASTLPQASCLNSLVTSDGVNAGTSVVDVSLLDENDRELSTCIRPLRDIPRNLLPICFLVTVGMRILQSHAPCRLP